MPAQAKRIVTKIDANPLLAKQNDENGLLRVAAYCRVSTDSEDQLESYKAQVAYYTDAIAKNPKWRFVDIYADEGITGTMATKRTNFMRMMRDCEKGKIDLILTKSVARFARNTVDSLKYVRKLKAKGIGVYFEEQALDSLKTENEMAIGLYSVLAQAESENISANVRWGIQQRMKSGTFKFRYNLLGYRKGENGDPEIVEGEAQHIRKIYEMYLDGNSLDQIKAELESNGVETKTGSKTWNKAIIQSILTNERYCGDLLMQKTFTENCITKKVKKNRGEMPKYLVKDNHPAIIDRVTFKRVQMEMARRSSVRKTSDKSITEQGKYSGKFALTDILICGECGSPYRRKTYSRNGKNKRVWRCLNRLEHGTEFCYDSITIDDEALKQAICRGINKAITDRQDVMSLILSNLSYAVTGQDDTLEMYAIEKQIASLNKIMDETMELATNSTGDGKRFMEEIKSLSEQIVVLREQLEAVQGRLKSNERVSEEIENIKNYLSSDNADFTEYNDTMVRRLVEYIRVMKDKTIIIVLKGGLQIEEKLEQI
ncbi:MAG: recombinase family protein [Eubacteriales bacterium]|nr:recombinase family protein [Eubacteriales bacterium]